MPIRPAVLSALVLGQAFVLGAAPARAECYDVLGCSDRDLFSRRFDYLASPGEGPTCEFLAAMRQNILAGHGWCVPGQEDASCTTDDPAAVRLGRVERANLGTILRAERLKACPR